MAWPTATDYQDAVLNPQFNFDDLDLKAGKPKLGMWDAPQTDSGSFACVFRMQCGQRAWAIKCFTREIKDQQERYQVIDQYISPLTKPPTHLPYIVEFDYLPKGILIRGRWYPILRMEWVQGELISKYVERNLHNPSALQKLAVRWVEMLKELQANSIAHGDLQHGNVLVVGDTLRLVDYDGMFVRTLQGQLSHEIGHRNYQHPERKEADFELYLDNFSAWVIYVSLVALSIDPSLWVKVEAGDKYECLLFRKADFEQPLLSPTLTLLTAHHDPNIRTLATLFRSMLFFPPQQVPSLDGQVPPDFQTDTRTDSNQAGWWSDHETTEQQVGTETVPHSKVSEPSASWILDFVSPSGGAQMRAFGQSMALPRLVALLSGVTFASFLGVSVLLPILSPAVLSEDSSYSSVLFLGVIVFPVILVYLNGLVAIWCYLGEPAVNEKRALAAREKKAREPIADLEEALIQSEKKKAALQTEESRQRKELDDALRRLREQEHKELDGIQTALKKTIAPIESRRKTIDQEERGASAKLIATLGYSVNSLKQQIATLAKAETDEITRELTTVQNTYKEDYLKRHPITGAPGLRYASRSSLESALLAHGIRTAYDISRARVDAVPGFGPKRTQALVNWRIRLEQDVQRLMPQDLSPSAKNVIRAKYEAQKKSLESQRDAEQAKFSVEDKAIRERGRMARQSLDTEQSATQGQANQRIQEINKRYAQEYYTPTQTLIQLTAEFSKKRREIDEQIRQLRQEMFGVSWQVAKINHEHTAYQNIAFLKYLKVVFLGQSTM